MKNLFVVGGLVESVDGSGLFLQWKMGVCFNAYFMCDKNYDIS